MQALPPANVPHANADDSAASPDSEQEMLARSLPTVPLAAHSLPQLDDASREPAPAAERQQHANQLAQPAGHRQPVNALPAGHRQLVNAQPQDEGNAAEADRQKTYSNQSSGSYQARDLDQGDVSQSGSDGYLFDGGNDTRFKETHDDGSDSADGSCEDGKRSR